MGTHTNVDTYVYKHTQFNINVILMKVVQGPLLFKHYNGLLI